MIPKIIHYCRFGGKPLPTDEKKSIASWKKYCPDYKIIQWNEDNFDMQCSEFLKKAYKDEAWAFVSDYARLKIIYEHGGIYLDTDVELLKNLDELLVHPCYIGVQQSEHLCATGLGFGAIPYNNIVRKMLSLYDQTKFEKKNQSNLACPILNTKVLEKEGYFFSEDILNLGECVIYPPKYFDPYAPGADLQNLLCEDTISIHHYSASWLNKNDILRRRLIRLIGQKRISWIKKVIKYDRK